MMSVVRVLIDRPRAALPAVLVLHTLSRGFVRNTLSRGVGLNALKRGLALQVLALALVLPGCIDSTFVPEDAGAAIKDLSAGTDAGPDLILPDVAADALADSAVADGSDAVDFTDASDTADAAADADAPGELPGDTTEADSADPDVPPQLLALGAPCTADSECASALCLTVTDPAAALAGNTATLQVCSQLCTGSCSGPTRCGIDLATGSATQHYCLPLPADLCKPCAQDADCAGKKCVVIPQTKTALCAMPCVAGSPQACPAGFVCQTGTDGDACIPALGTCSCTPDSAGADWPCALSNPVGTCPGSQTCGALGWSLCDAPLASAETCDGADNDCDGQTDEAFANLGKACGTGICASKLACSSDGNGTTCPGEAKKQPKETCGDNLDNNCNGQTDEGCPPKDVDGDGSPDGKDCAPYNAAYHPAAVEPCCAAIARGEPLQVPVTSQSKICDFDCSGSVFPCSPLDVDGDGFLPPVDCNDNDAAIHPGAPDACYDTIDSDCDGTDPTCLGLADEDNDGYNKDHDCDDNAVSAYPGAPEQCNNIDDNCDGVIDDGNPGGGADCGQDTGECQPGTTVCSHATGAAPSVECADEVAGTEESCNDKDDDCDGQTDEGFADLGKPCDSNDFDQCQNGVWVCNDAGDGVACPTESKLDLLELCKSAQTGNGVDEDCDGQTDEACYGQDVDSDGYLPPFDCNDLDSGYNPGIAKEPCCDPALGTTSPQALLACDHNCDGAVTACAANDADWDGFAAGDDCADSDPTRYPGAPEKCGDGIDQDCNGVDLDCAEIASVDGDGDGFAPPADCSQSPDINPFAVEVCDGKDNDCDGQTDEGNPGAKPGLCGSAVGACQPGQEACVRIGFGAIVQCIAKVAPGPELCNGKDDNCNGKTDEFFVGLGQSCDGDDADLCENGILACSKNGTQVICANETLQNLYELCNEVDDDCDGQTDEDLQYFGQSLGANCKGLGLCGKGKVVCSPELQVPVCSTDKYGTEPQSQPEQCNGADDDCDGLTDEDSRFAGQPVGKPCKAPGACLDAPGVVECGPLGKAICSTMPGGSAFAGTPEVCNGKDDNCDGHIDEALTTEASDCKQLGVCAGGGVVAVCKSGTWSCSYSAVVAYQGDSEQSCDGLDNDCDGLTDEDFQIGEPCDGPDADQCQYGKWVCGPDMASKVCGVEEIEDIPEFCNNLDDDCDAETDEDFLLGQPCDGPDLDSCKSGTWTCGMDGAGACLNETLGNQEELCDGKDNDCDGQTDELWPTLGVACDGDDTDKCKNGVVVCASATKAACGTESLSNIAEFCDSVDNDCDGQTDEDQFYQDMSLGQPCSGIGACGAGTVVCSPTKKVATCSTNPDAYLIFDGTELCDDIDNDCNGITDDDLSWQGIAKGQACPAIGVCGAGTVQCGQDGQAVCSTHFGGSNQQASDEACNGKDDDCDGQTDEDLTLEGSSCFGAGGVCAAGGLGAVCQNGAWQCNYAGVAGYEPTELSCDGLDNDCDGQTDEGFAVGEACDGDDTDSCKTGVWSCAGDGKSAVCDNELATNIPEVCDSQDNDCDGQTDEGFTYGPGKLPLGSFCKGVGVCGVGQVVCGANLTATCSTDADGPNSQATDEVCDGSDNDCDGLLDDGVSWQGLSLGTPCKGTGVCGQGVVICNPSDKTAVCSTNPGSPASQATPETCDAKDNDCDGQTDEGIGSALSTCNKLGQCAVALQASCNNGTWTCTYDPALGWESTESKCDDLDNDCNGVTDDGYPLKGQSCDGPDPDNCKGGSFVCTPNQLDVACSEPNGGGPTPETCDGKDNDCNGETDETFANKGLPCDGADADLCSYGTWTCKTDGSGLQCVNEYLLDVEEVCDNQDNDCDGQTDEGLGLGEPCDTNDTDQCKNGKWSCGVLGTVTCSAETKLNIQETCNDLDDDCDGVTDNGFELKGQKCDTAADNDSCKTGTFGCSGGGALTCQGDIACVSGASCADSGVSNSVDTCVCGSGGAPLCSLYQGDACNAASQSCTCKGGPACGLGQKCAASGCVPL